MNQIATTRRPASRKHLARAATTAAAALPLLATAATHAQSTVTWLGTVADTTAYTPGAVNPVPPLFRWDTTTANWSNTAGTGLYTVGDNVVFTDNFSGGTNLILPTSNMNPASITFAHVDGSAGPVTYTIHRSASDPNIPDFRLPSGSAAPATTPFGASTGITLTLDTGFNGTVFIRPRSNSGALAGSTTIRSGTLVLQDAQALPGNATSTQFPDVTLAGGTLGILIQDASGNTNPASSQLRGLLSVTADSTLALLAAVDNRVWNGPVNIATGATLTLDSRAGGRMNFLGTLTASTGTLKLAGTTHVQLQNSQGNADGPNLAFDLGDGTISNNAGSANPTQFDFGALSGNAASVLRGSDGTGVSVFSVGARGDSTTFHGVIANGNGAAVNLTKVGPGVLTLTNTNTYSGPTAVNGGVLAISSTANIGTNAALTFDGGTLRTLAPINPLNRTVTVNALGGAIDTNGFNSTLASSVTAAPTTAGPALFTKTGAGVLTVPNLRGAGAVAVDGGTLSVAANGSTAGASVVSAVSTTGTGKLDLNDNALVVDFATGAPSPIDSVRSLLASAAGPELTWTGPTGITSSLAAARATHQTVGPRTAIAYDDAAAYITRTGSNLFFGQTVDDSAVLLSYTLAGDATLDGLITDADVNALVANYNTPGPKLWSSADFTYDGLVTDRDLDLLATAVASAHPAVQVTPAALARLQSLAAAVPEPSTTALLLLTTLPTLRRRRPRTQQPSPSHK